MTDYLIPSVAGAEMALPTTYSASLRLRRNAPHSIPEDELDEETAAVYFLFDDARARMIETWTNYVAMGSNDRIASEIEHTSMCLILLAPNLDDGAAPINSSTCGARI